VIHRDISPSNVIVSRDGIAKLIDFGIAKARSARRSTQAGIIKGKHAYVAPEYTYGQLDRRADLWGLGVIAHELLSGRRLFVGENDAATIRNVRSQTIPPPSQYAPEISQDLDDIIMTALQRDPDQRFQNAGAMRVALTTEARRLRFAVSGAQIRDWVEWAFRQVPRSETTLNNVLDEAEPSYSIRSSELMPYTPPRSPTLAAAKRAITAIVQFRKRTPTAPLDEADADEPSIEEPSIDVPIVLDTPKRRSKPVATARPPRWNPPTRWMREPKRMSASPFVLLALIAFAVLAVANGWIDIEAWRALLA
jgi:serine/threonine protein kinase